MIFFSEITATDQSKDSHPLLHPTPPPTHTDHHRKADERINHSKLSQKPQVVSQRERGDERREKAGMKEDWSGRVTEWHCRSLAKLCHWHLKSRHTTNTHSETHRCEICLLYASMSLKWIRIFVGFNYKN